MNLVRLPIIDKSHLKTYSQLIVPTVAVAATFSKAYQFDDKQEQVNHLSNNLSTNFTAVALQKIPYGVFNVVAAAATFIRTFDEKTKYDKVCSVVQDSSWIACGLAVQRLLKNNPLFKHSVCAGNGAVNKLMAFIYDLCTFTIGTNLVAPKLEKFIRHIFVDPFVARNPQSRFGKENDLNSYDKFELVSDKLKEAQSADSPLPIRMDRFNLARIREAKPGKA
ncbi:MAG: hypothetical protein WCK67_02000 [bacterium]